MKFKATTLRNLTTLHTWTGLLAGFALFVAFYAGALTVFRNDISQWQSIRTVDAVSESADATQRLLDATLRMHPEARDHMGLLLAGPQSHRALTYWQDNNGTWQYASLENLSGSPTPPHAELSEMLNELHYSLGLPGLGTNIMGVVSLLYGLALFSGVAIHLPQLLKNLFALRRGRNLKQFWQDAHNTIGILSLPFHIVFAITGTLLCLQFVLMSALNPLVFDGKLMAALPAAFDTAPSLAVSNVAVSTRDLATWNARAIEVAHEQGLTDFLPVYLKLTHAGDQSAVIEISGYSTQSVGAVGSIALNASSGEVLASQLPGHRDANHGALAAAYALHFGQFGSPMVGILYFLLGIGGAFLFYSGNLLWIETRRKRRQRQQGRAPIVMATATIGVCLGFCIAVSTAFAATQYFESRATTTFSEPLRLVFFLTWALCAAWASLRPPARAARELLIIAVLATAAVPLTHGLYTGYWLWTSLSTQQWSLFSIDVVALGFAAVFGTAAAMSSRRAAAEPVNSVWAGD